MRLKKMLTAMLLMLSATAMADNYAYLAIQEQDKENTYSLQQISKITFNEANMILNMTDGSKVELPLAGLSKMFFTEAGPTGIMTAGNDKSGVRLIDGVVHVNAPAGSTVTLYNIKGQAIKSITATSEETEINVSNMTKGVYIVKVGGQSKKIMNK
jgi:hypothetical protein